MGKPTGFMEYEREVPVERNPKIRLNDWTEYQQKMPEEKWKKQLWNTILPYRNAIGKFDYWLSII